MPLSAIRQKGFSGSDVRFFLMAVHYRKPVNFSERALENAKNTVKKLQTFIQRLQSVQGMKGEGKSFSDTEQFIYELKHDFEAALDDDLNISGALVALFSFVRRINIPLSQNRISESDARKILDALKNMNEVLGILDFEVRTPQNEIEALIAKREKARSVRNWEEADFYRAKLAELGIDVLDTPQGVIWRYKR